MYKNGYISKVRIPPTDLELCYHVKKKGKAGICLVSMYRGGSDVRPNHINNITQCGGSKETSSVTAVCRIACYSTSFLSNDIKHGVYLKLKAP